MTARTFCTNGSSVPPIPFRFANLHHVYLNVQVMPFFAVTQQQRPVKDCSKEQQITSSKLHRSKSWQRRQKLGTDVCKGVVVKRGSKGYPIVDADTYIFSIFLLQGWSEIRVSLKKAGESITVRRKCFGDK